MMFRLLLVVLFLFLPDSLFALEIRSTPAIPIKNDTVLSPAKVELSLKPGSEVIQYLNVTNRTGREMSFNLDIEDFALLF